MPGTAPSRSNYLRKLFLFNHGIGLLIGICFPFFASVLLGPQALSAPFFGACLVAGFGLGAASFLFVRHSLKQQLHHQLATLQSLTGGSAAVTAGQTIEALDEAVQQTVAEVQGLLGNLQGTLDQFVPHYQTLADASRFLSARTEDGLSAARKARSDVDGMYQKQQQVMTEIETLNHSAQNEAAISRELSASLEEMAGALEHSTQKFLETTHSVDQLVGSIQEATGQSEQVAHSLEQTAHDLDGIGTALDNLRSGVAASAAKTDGVKQDAEYGLGVVRSFMEEMGRIEQESQKAVSAMQRLSRQTIEVTKIIEVIKGLVSDTELLAFNAAIIAAKAGAEGRGFSVVAEEIRDLADRTTTSAEEIEAIVKTIREDTRQVNTTVESTGRFIGRGMDLSRTTGEALGKIVDSSQQAAADSQVLVERSGEQSVRARALIDDAGRSLRSVRGVVQTMQQQERAIQQIHAGVSEMKGATDQIARGFDEQVKANREFDRSLAERETQVQAIFEATRYQMETVARIFEHFGKSESRLASNAERARVITTEITALEELATRLRELATHFQTGLDDPTAETTGTP